jgi:hypothetical protein
MSVVVNVVDVPPFAPVNSAAFPDLIAANDSWTAGQSAIAAMTPAEIGSSGGVVGTGGAP